MNKAINQIKKARKVLRSTTMKYPEDHEIAKMTGLSLDRIISASHCLRSVSSMNRGVDYMVKLCLFCYFILSVLLRSVQGYEKGLCLKENKKMKIT
jgi:hypothetical protein